MKPLHNAAGEGDILKVKQLVEEGADVNERNDRGEETPLHFVCFGTKPRHEGLVKVAKFLIDHGANVNTSAGKLKWTPLHYAAFMDHFEFQIIELFASHGASINAIDKFGGTPIDVAIEKGCTNFEKSMRAIGGRALYKPRSQKGIFYTLLNFMAPKGQPSKEQINLLLAQQNANMSAAFFSRLRAGYAQIEASMCVHQVLFDYRYRDFINK
ncbi:MAG: ankyrin repeat domain-containing protein [Planctomycetota bacterium]